jgi:hypothetical protein
LLYAFVEAHKTIYGTGTPVPKKLMEMFHLSVQGMIAHIMRQGRSILSVFQHSYRFFCNQEYIIHNTMTRPVQFSLGSLPTMSSFTQKLGAGWEGINENENISKQMSYKKK